MVVLDRWQTLESMSEPSALLFLDDPMIKNQDRCSKP